MKRKRFGVFKATNIASTRVIDGVVLVDLNGFRDFFQQLAVFGSDPRVLDLKLRYHVLDMRESKLRIEHCALG